MAVVLDPDICSTGSSVTNRCFDVGDGIRTVFNLAGLDSRRALLAPQIYLDQALQTYTTHYTTDSTGKVTFGTAPAAGKQVQYKEPHLPSVNVYRSFGVGDGASVNFSLPFAPATPSIYKSDWAGIQQLYATSRTNLIVRSQELNTGWTAIGTCTVTPDDAAAPDGTQTADKITGLGAQGVNSIVSTTIAGLGIGTRYEPSFWIKKSSSTGTLTIKNGLDAGSGTWAVDLSLLDTGWNRITRTSPSITITNEFKGSAGGGISILFYGSAGAPLAMWIWGVQVELGTSSTSYIPTVAAAASVTDYALDAAGAGNVTFASAPAAGAVLTWTGSMGDQQ